MKVIKAKSSNLNVVKRGFRLRMRLMRVVGIYRGVYRLERIVGERWLIIRVRLVRKRGSWLLNGGKEANSSHGGDVLAGTSDREEELTENLNNSSQSSVAYAGESGVVLPDRELEKCGVCNLVKKKYAAMDGTLRVYKGRVYCKDEV